MVSDNIKLSREKAAEHLADFRQLRRSCADIWTRTRTYSIWTQFSLILSRAFSFRFLRNSFPRSGLRSRSVHTYKAWLVCGQEQANETVHCTALNVAALLAFACVQPLQFGAAEKGHCWQKMIIKSDSKCNEATKINLRSVCRVRPNKHSQPLILVRCAVQ